jgi:clorobiocin biosynthesis protein Clo-hal
MKVLVLGGGPAGATTAGVLAKAGIQVQLVEKARHPRHHIGESLQPASCQWLSEHLGLQISGFPRKYGAAYVWGEKREPWTVLFDEKLERDLPGLSEEALLQGPYEHAFNVDRSLFDARLFQHVLQLGVEAIEAEVQELLFEGDRAVGIKTTTGSRLSADYLVDASGQSCLLARKLGFLKIAEDLRATATYAYYQDAGGYPGPLNRHIQWIITAPEGWIWFIPISAAVTSIGIVCRERSRMELSRFERILDQSGLPIQHSRRIPAPDGSPLYFARDWSYACSQLSGPNWLVVGDAAGFVDPILSGGVDFAIRGGVQAAYAILNGRLKDYADSISGDFKAYLRLARYWYGNNRSVQGFFWEAHKEILEGSKLTPYRAFVYLTTGHYAADRHRQVFQKWQEEKIFKALGVDRTKLSS